MILPDPLQEALTRILSKTSFPALEKASHDLSLSYRAQSEGRVANKPFMNERLQKYAYLALRFPAIYAAISACFARLTELSTDRRIGSLLDIGSGPGTLWWVAREYFPLLKEAVLLERDLELIAIGKELFESLPSAKQPRYIAQDMAMLELDGSFDLVSASYSLSELSNKQVEPLLDRMWQLTNQFLFIIEPGTPYGFDLIHRARKYLISKGGHIALPCTHDMQCPLFGTKEWCHFAARHERPELQRLVKHGTLGYEDEKYSYLGVAKQPLQRPYARIVKTPEKHSGHLRLTLCTAEGLENKTYSKRDKELYKKAKKSEWGDAI